MPIAQQFIIIRLSTIYAISQQLYFNLRRVCLEFQTLHKIAIYPSAICKTSDKSVENSAIMKKIKLVVTVLVGVELDVFTHRFKLKIKKKKKKKKKVTISHLIKLTNKSCMFGN